MLFFLEKSLSFLSPVIIIHKPIKRKESRSWLVAHLHPLSIHLCTASLLNMDALPIVLGALAGVIVAIGAAALLNIALKKRGDRTRLPT
jgi:hypothetical protein